MYRYEKLEKNISSNHDLRSPPCGKKRALDTLMLRRSTSKTSVYRIMKHHNPPWEERNITHNREEKNIMETNNGNQDIITVNRGKN